MGRYNLKKALRAMIRCFRCGQPLPNWPTGGCEIENNTGTERQKVCVKCMDDILNMRGVHVI